MPKIKETRDEDIYSQKSPAESKLQQQNTELREQLDEALENVKIHKAMID